MRRLECVDNILDMRYFKTVLPELEKDENRPHLFYEVKPNMRREQLEQLARSGVRWMQPGIESLDDRVLELLDKGGTGARNIQLLKWARELGCGLAWGFLGGVPGEDDRWYEELAERLPWLSHLQPPTALTRVRYDRSGPYHMHPERFGIRLSPLETYSHVFPLPEEDLAGLAYFFEDYGDRSRGDIDPLRPGDPRPGLAAVQAVIERWRRDFHGEGDAPVLGSVEEGDSLVLRDTRAVAVAERHELEGLRRSVYLAADRALPREALVRQVRKETARELGWSEIEPVLDELVERRLVLPIFGRYLSLGVPEPMTDLPSVRQTPEGYLKIGVAVRALAPLSLAKEARDRAFDIPEQLMHLFR